MAILKMWIYGKKAEASQAKNLGQSEMFFTSDTKKYFSKLRHAFIKASILNQFDPERHI